MLLPYRPHSEAQPLPRVSHEPSSCPLYLLNMWHWHNLTFEIDCPASCACESNIILKCWTTLGQLVYHTSFLHSAKMGWVCHLHDNGPFHHMTNAVLQTSYQLQINSLATSALFILKFSFLALQICIIHPTCLPTFFRFISLTSLSSLLFENFNYYIYLKKHVYKASLEL